MFRAILVEKDAAGYRAAIRELSEADLPDGDVRVRVAYSGLNYKDALAITGKAPVVRQFPMVPGIDLAGVVDASDSADFRPGDRVLLTGWGVGEAHWGGLAEQARVSSAWLTPLPTGFTERDAMAVGTAGFTAMLCVLALERHGVTPAQGAVVVTGAGGGVGGVAVALLARLGYRVAAVTGRPEEADYLRGLGASEVIDRAALTGPVKPLASERWAGAVDTVGGQILANVCAAVQYRGAVAACGMAAGLDFPASVAPFILRGITLAGVESVRSPAPERALAWSRLAADLDRDKLSSLTHEVGLTEVLPAAGALLEGHIRGRLVVDVRR